MSSESGNGSIDSDGDEEQQIEDVVDLEDEEEPESRVLLKCLTMSTYSTAHPDASETIKSHPASIILPEQYLLLLNASDAELPWHFEISNPENGLRTCCAVIMFTADRGTSHVPQWIQDNLGLKDGDMMSVVLKKLVIGEFAKLQPQSVEFLEVKDPKTALESNLRNFQCISVGDVIPVCYEGSMYRLAVLETKPENSICITNSDLTIDFAPPVGYVEPNCEISKSIANNGQPRIEPDWEFEVGSLTFMRPKATPQATSESKLFEPFSGIGRASGRFDTVPVGHRRITSNEAGGTPAKVAKIGRASDVTESVTSIDTLDIMDELIFDEFSSSEDEDEDGTTK